MSSVGARMGFWLDMMRCIVLARVARSITYWMTFPKGSQGVGGHPANRYITQAYYY